jgi:hypothetical protein
MYLERTHLIDGSLCFMKMRRSFFFCLKKETCLSVSPFFFFLLPCFGVVFRTFIFFKKPTQGLWDAICIRGQTLSCLFKSTWLMAMSPRPIVPLKLYVLPCIWYSKHLDARLSCVHLKNDLKSEDTAQQHPIKKRTRCIFIYLHFLYTLGDKPLKWRTYAVSIIFSFYVGWPFLYPLKNS